MKDKNAIGGNYKFSYLKVFNSLERLIDDEHVYRRGFDESECGFLYAELCLYNKLFDELDWSCTVRFVCTRLSDNQTICDLNKEQEIPKTLNTVLINKGWGNAKLGSFWKMGSYRWDVYIDGEFIKSCYFFIVNQGIVNATVNPYLKIKDFKLYESDVHPLEISNRNYLKVFNQSKTRRINLECDFEVVSKTQRTPLDFDINIYNDAGQHKAALNYFVNFDNRNGINLNFSVGYGDGVHVRWFEDNYTFEITFMNHLIAVIPFKVANDEIKSEGGIQYQTNNPEIKTETKEEEPEKVVTFEEATTDLDELIGLETVKKQIRELSTYLKFLKIRTEKGFEESSRINLHTVFMGNPGTGKTTVAKMLGKIYRSLGLLSKGHVHEVGRVDLVGEYIGQTAPKVKKAIDMARGGILFIDEAYALSNRGDDGKDFGKEVIEVLIKEMSDGAGDLAIIFAGYPNEMGSFLTTNPGMSSRISNHINFPDYVPDELMEICLYSAKKKSIHFADDAQKFLQKKIVEYYRNRDDNFGNARFINGVVEECKQNMALRLMNSPDMDALSDEELSTVSISDVQKAFASTSGKNVSIPVDESALEEALKELHELIGLETVKREVDELAKLVRYYTEIGRDVKNAFSMHTVFTGNPGTGKTTLARIIVKIYKALGILERGHLVETDRKDLVAGFTGQTAIKTAEVIAKSIGGGLFIDEAYALSQGNQNDFGKEAVDTLLKQMEDHRGEFIVIAAGYPDEMKKFLEINPGLMSRFDKTLHFADYTADELFRIGLMMFDKENLVVSEEACNYLKKYIEKLLAHKHKYFGNARSIRKVVKEIVMRQNLRLANMDAAQRTQELITTVEIDDFDGFELIDQDVHSDDGDRKRIGF